MKVIISFYTHSLMRTIVMHAFDWAVFRISTQSQRRRSLYANRSRNLRPPILSRFPHTRAFTGASPSPSQVRAPQPPPPAVSPAVQRELRALRRKIARLERRISHPRVTITAPTPPAVAPAVAAQPYPYPVAGYPAPASYTAPPQWPGAPVGAAGWPSPAATWAAPTAGRFATAGVGSSSVLAAVPTRPKVPPPHSPPHPAKGPPSV